jgi:hypothetical protein
VVHNERETVKRVCVIAKLWKKPRCPTTDECIKEKWHFYTMEFYSAIKEE